MQKALVEKFSWMVLIFVQNLEETLINLYMNEKKRNRKKSSWAQERRGPHKDRRNQQNKSVGI